MEINRNTFHWQLPVVLQAIADAHFVTIDLELSGIHSKTSHRLKTVPTPGSKQTLQQRYEEIKEAAEKYTILQIGLTCVSEDFSTGSYIARPFNFHLNPVPQERLDFERIFSYQSGAVEFLLSHGFRMEAPFKEGVPYLSRLEETVVREIESSRQNLGDIEIEAQDTESTDFLQRVRTEIKAWIEMKNPKADFLNIAPASHATVGAQSAERGLNAYQKRLVHQLVRAEFPKFVTAGKHGFIQIVAYNKKREDAVRALKTKSLEEKVARQTGMRWLVEALVGGDLSGIDPLTFTKKMDEDATSVTVDLDKAERDFAKLCAKLKSKKTILVGHNVFVDLVNFYHCFFGDLPDKVDDFQSIINLLFPLVIDTKYLATYNNSASNAKSGLDDLDHELSKDPVPVIETHRDHARYYDSQKALHHEAGYDSFLTAKVMIRLSARLEASSHYVGHSARKDGPRIPQVTQGRRPDQGGSWLNGMWNAASSAVGYPNNTTTVEGSTSPSFLIDDTDDFELPKRTGKRKVEEKDMLSFAHSGMFDALSGTQPKGPSKQMTTLLGTPVVMMPHWASEFWKIYGNKLRINGTIEGVCDLAIYGSD